MTRPRMTGLVVEVQYDSPVPVEWVAEAEDLENWPEKLLEAFPMVDQLTGRMGGMTRVARVAFTPDRLAMRIELDLTDVAVPE